MISIHCDRRLQFTMWNVTATWSDVRGTTLAEWVFRSDITLWLHYDTYIWSSLMSSISMMPCQRGPCDARENKSLLCPYTEILDMTFARPEASTVTTWTFCERTLEVLSDHSIHPFHAIFFSVWIFSNTMLPHVNEDNLIGHINKQINVCF